MWDFVDKESFGQYISLPSIFNFDLCDNKIGYLEPRELRTINKGKNKTGHLLETNADIEN